MKKEFYTTLKSPLGEILLTASDKGLTGLYTSGHALYRKARRGSKSPKPFRTIEKQLNEYFAGKRRRFKVSLDCEGTPFQKRVWKALLKVGYGRTATYGELARALKTPRASRAVGMANGKNPVCIIVPCHRVIGAGGKLTGYAGGLKAKAWLLDHEAGKTRPAVLK